MAAPTTGNFFVTGLPQLPNNTDPKVTQDLTDVYNALRNLANKVGLAIGVDRPMVLTDFAATVTPLVRRVFVPATVALAYGDLCNLFLSGGALKARKANATTTIMATAVCNTVGGLAIGAVGEFVLEGPVRAIGGMVVGSNYYTSTTAGAIQTPAPAGAGNMVQGLGMALAADFLLFRPDNMYRIV